MWYSSDLGNTWISILPLVLEWNVMSGEREEILFGCIYDSMEWLLTNLPFYALHLYDTVILQHMCVKILKHISITDLLYFLKTQLTQ